MDKIIIIILVILVLIVYIYQMLVDISHGDWLDATGIAIGTLFGGLYVVDISIR
ncbi:hypothetical protein [Lentilactobacillus sp. SPB1-3]|uniref:Uncharacterized protein n=1 Tax=Lentilactobacillus terminaliae TaxID=3003483 RepID=A0ACD5DCY2_9LACO